MIATELCNCAQHPETPSDQGLGSVTVNRAAFSRHDGDVVVEGTAVACEAVGLDGGGDRCADNAGDVDIMSIKMTLMIPSKRGKGVCQWKCLKATDSCPLCSYAIVSSKT